MSFAFLKSIRNEGEAGEEISLARKAKTGISDQFRGSVCFWKYCIHVLAVDGTHLWGLEIVSRGSGFQKVVSD